MCIVAVELKTCASQSKARRVEIKPRLDLQGELHRWLMPVVVLFLGLGWTGAASASLRSPSASFNAEDHARHCNCGPKCRQASCCCGRPGTRVRPPAPPPVPGPIGADPSPCMGSAPCEESGLPTAPSSVGPLGKLAALAMGGHLLSANAVGLRLVSPPCLLPTRRASRLDRPPKHLIVA